MEFKINKLTLPRRLQHPGRKVKIVLDTDTYNEVDDQFALAYAIKSPKQIDIQAIYAAPFYNQRSASPEEGMHLSFKEIHNIVDLMDSEEYPIFEGSTRFLEMGNPEKSEAVQDMIQRALEMDSDDPLYIVAIGAITNVASAILLEPKIIENIVIVWLGGHSFSWHNTKEFNLMQDIAAARVVFDSGVPLVQIPCRGVASHLITSVYELKHYLYGKSAIGTYLTEIVKSFTSDPFGWSKVIWDISAIAWLIDSSWVPTYITNSPIITDQTTWSFDERRHLIKYAYYVDRNNIFADMFRKLAD